MSKANYRKSIDVTSNASTAFEAVTRGIEQWWTQPDRPMRQISDRAKFTFPPGKSGLTPQLLCYDICEAGWDMFFLHSLKQYLDTGRGKPHKGATSQHPDRED